MSLRPHSGGEVFECLIKSTKWSLHKIISQARLMYNELLTAITEVEMVITSWPLSNLPADGLVELLTPSHLMVAWRLMSVPNRRTLEEEDEDIFTVNSDTLTRWAKHLCATTDRIWVSWKREYLLELRETYREHSHKSSVPRISVNDVVIIQNDNQPHGM